MGMAATSLAGGDKAAVGARGTPGCAAAQREASPQLPGEQESHASPWPRTLAAGRQLQASLWTTARQPTPLSLCGCVSAHPALSIPGQALAAPSALPVRHTELMGSWGGFGRTKPGLSTALGPQGATDGGSWASEPVLGVWPHYEREFRRCSLSPSPPSLWGPGSCFWVPPVGWRRWW